MKIVAINGSPNGKESNTNVIINAFLNGAIEAGAETINIFLSEKRIEYCKGCHTCWLITPGSCVIKDDMAEIISLLKGASAIVLASPLYFANISGTLKVFIDRLTATGGDPHNNIKENGFGDAAQKKIIIPKFIMISNCGFPDRSQFQVISLWINRVAQMMQTEVKGEIYVTREKLLKAHNGECSDSVINFLYLLKTAGNEIATDMELSDSTKKLLEQNIF